MEIIQLGALLHDIGKIGVSEKVLNKKGALTDEEFDEIKKHPVNGAEMLQRIHHKHINEITQIVLYHHEKWNGKGYPEGLKEDNTPQLARVVAVADAFDAMTTDRPYRKGFTADKAISIIKECAGSHFDPVLAKIFQRMYAEGGLVLPATMAKKYAIEDPDGDKPSEGEAASVDGGSSENASSVAHAS